MLRTKLAALTLIPALALGFAACAGPVETDESEGVAESESALFSQTHLYGTFRARTWEAGKMTLLVFKSDGTYHREIMKKCPQMNCTPVVDDGGYTVWGDGREINVSLFLHGKTWENYQLIYHRTWIRLIGENGMFQDLVRTPQGAWCDAANDCSLQHLPRPDICLPNWECNDHYCHNICGLPPKPE